MSISTYKIEDGVLTVFASGRIDSSNAQEFSKECEEARSQNHSSMIFDFLGLEYISSAGLRVILITRKKEKNLSIVNVSPDVFDILDMTGITEIVEIKKAMRTIDITGCKVVGKGEKAVIYQYDEDNIVKVFSSSADIELIEKERKNARQALIMGVPTAISYDVVKVGESFGAEYELINAQSMSMVLRDQPERIDECVEVFTNLLKEIHAIEIKGDEFPSVTDTINVWINDCKNDLNDNTVLKLRRLLSECKDTHNLLHFDYHTNNVMVQPNDAIVIDMDKLCNGNIIFELANTYVSFVTFGRTNPMEVETFFGFSYEFAEQFWNKFIRCYLETDDEEKVAEVMEKVELLSNLRQLRHYARRARDNEECEAAIDYSKARITELIDKVSTLDF